MNTIQTHFGSGFVTSNGTSSALGKLQLLREMKSSADWIKLTDRWHQRCLSGGALRTRIESKLPVLTTSAAGQSQVEMSAVSGEGLHVLRHAIFASSFCRHHSVVRHQPVHEPPSRPFCCLIACLDVWCPSVCPLSSCLSHSRCLWRCSSIYGNKYVFKKRKSVMRFFVHPHWSTHF